MQNNLLIKHEEFTPEMILQEISNMPHSLNTIDGEAEALWYIDQYFQLGIQPKKQILGDWILENDLVYLFGRTGIGKTLAAVDIGLAVARGEECWGLTNEYKGNPLQVLYLDAELTESDWVTRYGDYTKEFPRTFIRPLRESILKTNMSLQDIENYLTNIIIKYNIEFLIIDNLQSYFPLILHEHKDAIRIRNFLFRLRDEFQLTILAINHTPKITNKDLRLSSDNMAGASLFQNGANNILLFDQSKNGDDFRYIEATKARHSKKNKILEFEIKKEEYLKLNLINPLPGRNLQQEREDNYKQIAKEIFDLNENLAYNDMINKYIEITNKSAANAKKVIQNLVEKKIIQKNGNKFYKIKV